MLRLLVILACTLLVAGCAQRQTPRAEPMLEQEPVAAAALVFDPPLVRDQPPLALARAPRQPAALVGYDELITTYFYLRMDDRQLIDTRHDWTVRRAITTKIGVSHR